MIHNIRFRLFIYNNENPEELLTGLNNILPDAQYEVEIAEGIDEKPIQILTGKVSKKRQTKEFLKNLTENVKKEELVKLKQDLERKTDERGNLFLRINKYDAIDEKWTIIDKGDSLHLKIKIAAYPAKKEIAIDKIKSYLEEILWNSTTSTLKEETTIQI